MTSSRFLFGGGAALPAGRGGSLRQARHSLIFLQVFHQVSDLQNSERWLIHGFVCCHC
jgi:hypothetical protein